MKSKGFTLIELLCCMALIGIVLSLGAWVYQVFQGFQHRYHAQVEHTYDFLQLQDRLSKDFENAAAIESIQTHCIALRDTRNIETVRYCIRPQFFTRSHQGLIDTFEVKGTWQIKEKALFIQESSSNLNFSFHLPSASQAKITAPLTQDLP